MKNELISFETAKLAKEKGFYLETELYYSSETKVLSVSYDEYSAPTQSLLQKWLREVHNIHINIDCWKKATFHSIHDKDKKGSFYPKNPSIWNTYEEALEVGLHQALLLIK